MAVHKGPASLRPRCTWGGSSVAAIPEDRSSPHQKWIFDCALPPSEDRRCDNHLGPDLGYCTTPCCSSFVQSCKGVSMFSPSLLPHDWRQSTLLQMVEPFNRHRQYCASSSLSQLPRNLKIAFTFWFTLIYGRNKKCISTYWPVAVVYVVMSMLYIITYEPMRTFTCCMDYSKELD
jgi:hypothetical protein